MRTFLSETAAWLYGECGDGISSLKVVFPSRRSRLFFNEALAGIAGKPLWQPEYLSVDDLMQSVAGVVPGDKVRLVAELYKVYSQYHDEPFDTFYYWGEVLLSDFDSIDKYMIEARTLFVNIADIKNIESDLSYLTPHQLEIIRRFWTNFNVDDMSSEEKRRFVGIWDSLLDIYTGFRERLISAGVGYPGLIYRVAAEKIKAGDFDPDVLGGEYAIIGFNALSEAEKVLFDYLHRAKKGRFFWDYDDYYIQSKDQEAGLFLRENIARYPGNADMGGHDHFTAPKEIVAVAAPSDAVQSKYVTSFLEDMMKAGMAPGKETAIVLTDENLLLPVLSSVPDGVEDINVTMGYPLRQTPAYTLLERLAALQQHKKARGGSAVFYHADVTGLLNHPYMQAAAGEMASGMAAEIVRRQQIYVPARRLAEGDGLLAKIFAPVEGWEQLGGYMIDVFTELDGRIPADGKGDMRREFFALITDSVYRLGNSLRGCGLELSDGVMLSLLRKTLQNVRVPYEGEPLKGVQIMGILETRNLDFENVVILSVNDDTFPGNLSASSSFIPYNLRVAYGLPTPQHHEGVYGYYFYRLLQRAKRVHMVYSVKSDEKKTGEPSRYIYQLDYESLHDVVHRNMTLDINFSGSEALNVEKTGEVLAELRKFLGRDAQRHLSPSSLNNYLDCPMKFYFQMIAGIREEEEITEEVDLPMFGNIFHKAAEVIYGRLAGKSSPGDSLRELIGSKELKRIVDGVVNSEYFMEDSDSDANFGGNIMLVRDIVLKYLNVCLLPYDAENGGFEVYSVEMWVEGFVPFDTVDGVSEAKFAGKVDRVDRMEDGRIRVVDYKTGKMNVKFGGVEKLFSEKAADRNPAVLQTLTYSMLLNKRLEREVVPSLFYVRHMNEKGFSPLLADASGGRQVFPVTAYTPYGEELEGNLRKTLAEVFDPAVPFVTCDDKNICKNCSFSGICGNG